MLINEILDLSRVEAGRYELKEEPVSLPGVVEDCRRLLSMRAKSRNLTITETLDRTCRASGPTSARCARSRSICSPTPSSSRRRAARSRSRSAGPASGGQYVSIRDTGPGIPPEEIPIVLSSFGRGSLAHKNAEEGTGLGLPIVKGLVELHGGQFRLTSKVRQGTEAVVIFPPERVMSALRGLDPDARPRSAAEQRAASAADGKRSDAGPARRDRSARRLLAEAGGVEREMDLVLEARVLALDEQRRGVGHRAADRLDPGHLRLGEVAQHEIVHERLVAGMADAEPHPPVFVADMGGDRTQAVVPGVAARRS